MNNVLLHLSQVPDVCRQAGCVPTCPLDNQIPRENLQPYGPILILNTFKAIAQHFNKHLFNVVRVTMCNPLRNISTLYPNLVQAYHHQSIKIVVALVPRPISVDDHLQPCGTQCPDFILASRPAYILPAGTTSGFKMTHLHFKSTSRRP